MAEQESADMAAQVAALERAVRDLTTRVEILERVISERWP